MDWIFVFLFISLPALILSKKGYRFIHRIFYKPFGIEDSPYLRGLALVLGIIFLLTGVSFFLDLLFLKLKK